MLKDNNHRFKINMDNYGTSKGELILYQVERYSVAHRPTILGLVRDLSSGNHALDSLGVNKSSKVRMFAFRELKYPTDALDELIHTLRNEELTYMILGSSDMLSTNTSVRINEKFIIEEIEGEAY